MERTDYIYCEDCQMFVDLWKYDSLEDTGHADCHWRYVTDDELKNCVVDCEADGCFQSECPKCGHQLQRTSGVEIIPDHWYCPECMDTAYNEDGQVIAQLI